MNVPLCHAYSKEDMGKVHIVTPCRVFDYQCASWSHKLGNHVLPETHLLRFPPDFEKIFACRVIVHMLDIESQSLITTMLMYFTICLHVSGW